MNKVIAIVCASALYLSLFSPRFCTEYEKSVPPKEIAIENELKEAKDLKKTNKRIKNK